MSEYSMWQIFWKKIWEWSNFQKQEIVHNWTRQGLTIVTKNRQGWIRLLTGNNSWTDASNFVADSGVAEGVKCTRSLSRQHEVNASQWQGYYPSTGIQKMLQQSPLPRCHLHDRAALALFRWKFKIPNLSHRKRIIYIYIELLNLDKIKNKLHSLLVNCETNLMSLIDYN